MSKAFRTAGTSTRPRISAGMVAFIVFAIAFAIALITHGVGPMVGLPLAIVGALVIDRALFGSRR